MTEWKFSRSPGEATRTIRVDENITIGNPEETVLIAGPCSIESLDQIEEVARCLVDNGVKVLRAGCYKPRTNPYSFRGLEEDGLKMLAEVREKYGLKIITEVKDSTQVQTVLKYTDIVQIGAKAMWDYGILEQLSKTQTPTLVKRAFGATTQEAAQITEYILSGGNDNVMVCERGIRTFEPNTRFTLDLCGAEWIKKHTNLPLVLDPSHAMGFRYGVSNLALACIASGTDALMVEVHPDPSIAKSDASQQLNLKQFSLLVERIHKVAAAIDKKII